MRKRSLGASEIRPARDLGPRSEGREPGLATRRPAAIVPYLLFVTLLFALGADPSLADLETFEAGRRFRTPAKLVQSALDGVPLNEPSTQPVEWGLEIYEKVRVYRAYPSQPVSVGLLGCPGCSESLGWLGGIYIDVGRGRQLGRPWHGSPSLNPPHPKSDRRDPLRKPRAQSTPPARPQPKPNPSP
jgi:hypothetical protein